jgi:hypothetical protein
LLLVALVVVGLGLAAGGRALMDTIQRHLGGGRPLLAYTSLNKPSGPGGGGGGGGAAAGGGGGGAGGGGGWGGAKGQDAPQFTSWDNNWSDEEEEEAGWDDAAEQGLAGSDASGRSTARSTGGASSRHSSVSPNKGRRGTKAMRLG